MNDFNLRNLSDDQRRAVIKAAQTIAAAQLQLTFCLMVFGDKADEGAVVSNIKPADAVAMIEQALQAAKANVRAEIISGEETLQ
jgi:hypothetical protein